MVVGAPWSCLARHHLRLRPAASAVSGADGAVAPWLDGHWFAELVSDDDDVGRVVPGRRADHRGHGRGIRGHDTFTLEDCADDAVALMDVLGVRRAIVVGYSMGGPIAQLMWRRHPDRVCGLVLCATAADFTPRVDLRPFARALQHLHAGHLGGARGGSPRMARPLISNLLTDREVCDGVLEAMTQHVEPVIREAGQAIGRFRSTSWIGDIDVPVVVVLTTRDRLVPPARQRHLATSIPERAPSRSTPDTSSRSHGPTSSHALSQLPAATSLNAPRCPAGFTRAVRRFLEKRRRRRQPVPHGELHRGVPRQFEPAH